MKITFDWLKDHLKTNLKEKHLLEQLTNIGLEVESVEKLSADNELFKKFKSECNKTGTTEEALANADKLGFNTNLFAQHPFIADKKIPIFFEHPVNLTYSWRPNSGYPAP